MFAILPAPRDVHKKDLAIESSIANRVFGGAVPLDEVVKCLLGILELGAVIGVRVDLDSGTLTSGSPGNTRYPSSVSLFHLFLM